MVRVRQRALQKAPQTAPFPLGSTCIGPSVRKLGSRLWSFQVQRLAHVVMSE
jgi:hypothetical protein